MSKYVILVFTLIFFKVYCQTNFSSYSYNFRQVLYPLSSSDFVILKSGKDLSIFDCSKLSELQGTEVSLGLYLNLIEENKFTNRSYYGTAYYLGKIKLNKKNTGYLFRYTGTYIGQSSIVECFIFNKKNKKAKIKLWEDSFYLGPFKLKSEIKDTIIYCSSEYSHSDIYGAEPVILRDSVCIIIHKNGNISFKKTE